MPNDIELQSTEVATVLFLDHSQQLFDRLDVASVIEREKHWVVFKYLCNNTHNSLFLFSTPQPEDQYAYCLSEVTCFSNKRF